jgi:hypothetical protein
MRSKRKYGSILIGEGQVQLAYAHTAHNDSGIHARYESHPTRINE